MVIDRRTEAQIMALARMQCTVSEIAGVLDISERHFYDIMKAYPHIPKLMEKGREQGKASLRRTQFKLADTNPGMAIFLGKNWLGQTDRQDLRHEGEVQITVDRGLDDDDDTDDDSKD